jgi:hypothetical protein
MQIPDVLQDSSVLHLPKSEGMLFRIILLYLVFPMNALSIG